MVDDSGNGRVTTKELYESIGDLRSELLHELRGIRAELKLYSTQAVCEEKHANVDASIRAAVAAGAADREKLWEAHHENEDKLEAVSKQMWIFVGAASVISPLALALMQYALSHM